MSNREYKVFKNLVQRVYLRSSYSGPLIILIIHASALALKLLQPLLVNTTTSELKWSNLGKETWVLFFGEQGA